jgi:hypothetical protein
VRNAKNECDRRAAQSSLWAARKKHYKQKQLARFLLKAKKAAPMTKLFEVQALCVARTDTQDERVVNNHQVMASIAAAYFASIRSASGRSQSLDACALRAFHNRDAGSPNFTVEQWCEVIQDLLRCCDQGIPTCIHGCADPCCSIAEQLHRFS